jgi:iron complex outermembrane receptor protein
VIPINPFSLTNFYFDYTLGTNSILSESKLRLSVNNLFDNYNIVGDAQAAAGSAYVVGNGDLLQLLPGRSVTLTMTIGVSPRR